MTSDAGVDKVDDALKQHESFELIFTNLRAAGGVERGVSPGDVTLMSVWPECRADEPSAYPESITSSRTGSPVLGDLVSARVPLASTIEGLPHARLEEKP
jgi:hypothetical protein